MTEALDELLAAWRELAEDALRRARSAALADDTVRAVSRTKRAEAAFAAGVTRLDLLEQRWRREFAADVESRLERAAEDYRGEISVRQGEIDDIAALVGVPRDAPWGAVRDRVAELARAGDQLKMAT